MDVFDIRNKRRSRLLVAAQPPALKIFDIPAQCDSHLAKYVLAPHVDLNLFILMERPQNEFDQLLNIIIVLIGFSLFLPLL